MEREIRALKDKLALGLGSRSGRERVDVDGVKVVATQVDGADAGALRNAVDQLKSRLKSAVIVLASVDAQSKVLLVAGVTADQTARVKAGELVGIVAAQSVARAVAGPDFAQAGGTNPAALDAALARCRSSCARLAAPPSPEAHTSLARPNGALAAMNPRDCSQRIQSFQRLLYCLFATLARFGREL